MNVTQPKKIVLAAGTGQLGKAICKNLYNDFDEFIILTRGAENKHGMFHFVHWDAKSEGPWQQHLENATAVVNLTGKNVNCRYTDKNKKEILNSRIESTSILGKTIQQLESPPKIWINLASATIFRDSKNEPMTEKDTDKYGEGFSVDICKAWEKTFYSFSFPATRQVCFRVGMALGNQGGVFPVLKRLVRLGLGGKMGNGKQQVSWIDDYDFCAMVKWAVDNEKVQGTYNCTSPFPVSNNESMQLLRKNLHVPFGLPSPRFLLEIGSFFIRTETELVLKSRFVFPQRATEEGFVFSYPDFDDSIKHILSKA